MSDLTKEYIDGLLARCSSEQAKAVMHGSSVMGEKSATRIKRPTWPFYVPDWLLGVHVNYMDGYSNDPYITFKVSRSPMSTVSNLWRKKKGSEAWFKEGDGLCEVHYHKGAVALREFKEFKGWAEKPSATSPGVAIHETYQMLATTSQAGYGGRHFDLQMAEDSEEFPGERVRLVGPWHGGPMKGYHEVSYILWDEKERTDKWHNRRRTPWHRRTGFFGATVSTELLVNAFSRFLPHLELYLVEQGPFISIQPADPRTGFPKGFCTPIDCPGHIYHSWRCVLCGETDPAWEVEKARQRAEFKAKYGFDRGY